MIERFPPLEILQDPRFQSGWRALISPNATLRRSAFISKMDAILNGAIILITAYVKQIFRQAESAPLFPPFS